MKRVLIAALTVVVSGAPAQAASILEPLLGSPGDCYYRAYTEAHLRSHPRQMVETIAVYYETEYQDNHSDLTVSFDITTRDGKSYEGVGICTGNECGVEGDGGRFKLTPDKGGALRLDVMAGHGMSAEGASGYISLDETDDTVFLLYPERSRICQP